METLLKLMDVHEDLREKLAVHRDLVVGLEFARAADALHEYERSLRRHMQDEETHILPLYEARVGDIPGGKTVFFLLEHLGILRHLDQISRDIRALAADPRAGRRQAHEFLEKESMLLHLLEHHERRERNILYPKLTEKLSPTEVERTLHLCSSARVLP